MRRVLHWKRLLLIAVAACLLSGSAYALNVFQVMRQASTFKERAERTLEEAKQDPAKREQAVSLYEQYLKFRPQDEDGYAQYARLQYDVADAEPNKRRVAADAAIKFLRRFPDHPEERRKLIEILMKLGSLNLARDHLDVLFKTPKGGYPEDLDLLDKAAAIEEFERKYSKAYEYVERALRTDKDPAKMVPFYARGLNLLFRQRRDTEANGLIETLLKTPPYDARPDARVVVVRYLLGRREYDNAREHVAKARLMPGGEKDTNVLLASAQVEMAGRDANLHAARGYLEAAFAIDPKNVEVGGLLAEVLSQGRELDKAVQVLHKTADALGEVRNNYYAVVDKLLDLRDTGVSEKLIERMNETNTEDFILQYFRGRLLLAKGEWPAARRELEACAPALTAMPANHKKALSDLGRCYALSHNPDQMLEAYESALKDDAGFVPAQLGKADALVKLGRVREAVPIYRDLSREYKGLQATLARLVLLDQLGKPAEARDWRTFEESLGPPPLTTDLMLLKAEGLHVRRETAAARAVLEDAAKGDPKNPAIAMKLLRIGTGGAATPRDALAMIEEAERRTGDGVDFRLARAAVMAVRPKKPSVEELRALGTKAPTTPFAKGDLYRLWFGLGEAAMRLSSQPEMGTAALEFFRNAAAAEPLDLSVRAVLIDIGLALGRADVWEASLKEIADAEGPDGPIYNLGQVAVKLSGYKPGDRDLLRDLRARAEGVQKKRPGWSRAYLALAQIDELEGYNDAALTHLKKAIELGEKQEKVVRRTVEFLRERKQYKEAAKLLNDMDAQMYLPDDLQRFRAIMNLLTKDVYAQDIREIDRFAPAEASTYELQLFRGTLLSAIGQNEGAERAFRKALERLPADRPNAPPLEAWTGLVGLLARTEKLDEARRAVAEAESKLRSPPRADSLLTLAACHEVVGDIADAEKCYRQVVEAAPSDPSGHRQLVGFFQRQRRTAESEAMLEGLTHNPGQDIARWARRELAIAWMTKPDAFNRREAARELVDRNLRDAAGDPEDRKAMAMVLCVDPARRAEGMKVFADFASRFELTPDEYYLLGKLCFDQGKLDDAQRYFEFAVLPRPNVSVEHLAGIVRLYLAVNDTAKARKAAERLGQVAPKSWEATREAARVLVRDGNPTEAKALILKFPGAEGGEAIAARTGPLLEEIGAYDDAERLYRKYVESSKAADAHLRLAVFYINRKQTDKAIELAQKYEARTPVEVTARLLSGAVRARLPGPDAAAKVEAWLARKMAENEHRPGTYPQLVGALAELRDAQGRYTEAIAEYRRTLELAPNERAANNLAILLALHEPEKAEEAKQIIDRVIALRGPVPTYLDTRAVASLLLKGESQQLDAIKDLKLALAQQQKPIYYFHLAWAYDLLRRETDKREALARALQLGLTTDDVHPKELAKYRELFER